jgi:hypothetical protein
MFAARRGHLTVTMQALLPILVPLLSPWGLCFRGVLNPSSYGDHHIQFHLQRIIMPAVYIACVFILVNSLSEKDYVKKLAQLIRASRFGDGADGDNVLGAYIIQASLPELQRYAG